MLGMIKQSTVLKRTYKFENMKAIDSIDSLIQLSVHSTHRYSKRMTLSAVLLLFFPLPAVIFLPTLTALDVFRHDVTNIIPKVYLSSIAL